MLWLRVWPQQTDFLHCRKQHLVVRSSLVRSRKRTPIPYGSLSMRENLVMTSPYVRPYVHTFFPLSPREFCPLLFQTEQVVGSFYTGAVHLTFEGVMGDFSKISCRLIWRRKVCKEIPGKNNILHWKKRFRSWRYDAEKILHRCMSGKKFLTHQMFGKKEILRHKFNWSTPWGWREKRS